MAGFSNDQNRVQVELAKAFMESGVVGIDLSGNPTVGSWDTWEPALQAARQVLNPRTTEISAVNDEHLCVRWKIRTLCRKNEQMKATAHVVTCMASA